MSLATLLIHTLEVHQRTGRIDRFGQQVDVNPTRNTAGQVVTSFPCRLTRGKGGLVMRERAVDVFEKRYTIFLEPDAGVTEDDAVRVIDASGNELLPLTKVENKTMAYDGVGAHHLELHVWSQRGPA